jgi:hypothetical protein
MTNIEQIHTREEQLEKLSLEQRTYADQYKKARLEYAQALHFTKVELAKKIESLQAKKKNVGIEMAEIMCMSEDAKAQDQWFIKACKTRDEKRAEYKGLGEILESIKSHKMSILGIMRNGADQERYTPQENKNGNYYKKA